MLEKYVNVDKLDKLVKLNWDKLDEDKLNEIVSSNGDMEHWQTQRYVYSF